MAFTGNPLSVSLQSHINGYMIMAIQSPYYAALDLGSNSFHLIVVQVTESGVQEVDKIKHMVRLGEGLGEDNHLDAASIARALEALQEMGQRISHIPREQIRAVGTNTMRVAQNGTEFLRQAEAALGTEIEIISGTEEARLIYLGITEHNHFKDENLVIDVGGGSTEIILGDGAKPEVLRSMKMGCANMAARFFPKGKITKMAVKRALSYVGKTVEPHIEDMSCHHFERAIMSSGTAKSTEKALQKLGLSETGITRSGLKKLLDELINIGKAEKLAERLGIDEARAFGFAGGVCILSGLCHNLNIEQAIVSQQALREGVLIDLMGRASGKVHDEREITITALQQRFNTDNKQAERVKKLAEYLSQAFPTLAPVRFRPLLGFAASLHEIGLAVARGKHQNHGAYLMEHADMPGFSQLQQKMMAVLVKGQRKKMPTKYIAELPKQHHEFIWQFVLILRLAVLLHRGRFDIPKTAYPKIDFADNTVTLLFPNGFLDNHPLTVSDLLDEQQYWQDGSIYQLKINLPDANNDSELSI